MEKTQRQKIRDLAIELLDDDHGISLTAWEELFALLEEHNHWDVIQAVKIVEGRAFVSEQSVLF